MTQSHSRITQVTLAAGMFFALALLGVTACSGSASAKPPAAAPAPSHSSAPARALSPAPGATSVQSICAGQCGPPYQLVVVFRPRVSLAAARAILRRCGAVTVVTKIGPVGAVQPNSRRLSAVLFTSVIGAETRSDGLLRCLHRSASVTGAGWPD